MNQKTTVTIIGAKLDLGAEDLGSYEGPDVLRSRKIKEKLEDSGLKVTDLGNIEAKKREHLAISDPTLPYIEEIVRTNELIATTVADNLNSSKVVILGGDHSVNLGAFSGATTKYGQSIGLVYIDAHGDINTPESSLSHNIHGMHLASLMGFGPNAMTQIANSNTKLPIENLLHIGACDLDDAEKDLIKTQKINAFTLFDLETKGMGKLIECIDDLSKKTDAIWISLDLDAIDWVYAPGVGIPNQGGLTYREIALITEYIGQNCNVVGMDIVEYNPKKDIDFKTAELAIDLTAKLCGSNYSWYTNYMARQKD